MGCGLTVPADLITYDPGAIDTMTVSTTTPPNLPVPISGDAAGLSILGDWLTAAESASALARQLVHSFFVPQAYKPSGPNGVEVAVANATGAILLGQSLGLDPLTSLQQIYVVHGRPGMYSKMKVALAQRAGHRIWEEEYTPERSTWAGQRAGSEDVVRITLTIEDAKRAGWTSNAAYSKTPADMLAARCQSRVVDRIAADALFGLRSIEDLDDEPAPVAVAAKVTAAEILAKPAPTPAAAPSAVRQEPTPAAAAVVPPLPGEGGPSDEGPKQEAPLTAKQWREINDLFVTHGVTGPGQSVRRLAVLDMLFGDLEAGRLITKGTDLTEAEGRTAIDWLRANGPAIIAEALGGTPAATEAAVEQILDGAADARDAAARQAEAEATYPEALPDPADGGDPWAGQ